MNQRRLAQQGVFALWMALRGVEKQLQQQMSALSTRASIRVNYRWIQQFGERLQDAIAKLNDGNATEAMTYVSCTLHALGRGSSTQRFAAATVAPAATELALVAQALKQLAAVRGSSLFD